MKIPSMQAYDKKIQRILSDKLKGYKTLGAISGAGMGMGIGGSAGLLAAAQKHKNNEFDKKNKLEIAKEYMGSAAPSAAKGLLLGAGAGTLLGEAGKRYTVHSAKKEALQGLEGLDEQTKKEILKSVIRILPKEFPKQDIYRNTKVQIKSMIKKMLNKKAAVEETSGYNSLKPTVRIGRDANGKSFDRQLSKEEAVSYINNFLNKRKTQKATNN